MSATMALAASFYGSELSNLCPKNWPQKARANLFTFRKICGIILKSQQLDWA